MPDPLNVSPPSHGELCCPQCQQVLARLDATASRLLDTLEQAVSSIPTSLFGGFGKRAK